MGLHAAACGRMGPACGRMGLHGARMQLHGDGLQRKLTPAPPPPPPNSNMNSDRVAAQCTGQEFAIPISSFGRSVEFICEQILRACAKVRDWPAAPLPSCSPAQLPPCLPRHLPSCPQAPAQLPQAPAQLPQCACQAAILFACRCSLLCAHRPTHTPFRKL